MLAEIARILGEAGISIEAVVQPEPPRGADHARLVMLTHRVREGDMRAALARVEALEAIAGDVVRIRMETLDGDS